MFTMTIQIEADNPEDLASAFASITSRGAKLEAPPPVDDVSRASGNVVYLDAHRQVDRHA